MPAEDPGTPEAVTLIDESGRERKFRMHDAFDLEGLTYYLVEGWDDPEEVLLLRETQEGALETVEDEEFQRVMKALDDDVVE